MWKKFLAVVGLVCVLKQVNATDDCVNKWQSFQNTQTKGLTQQSGITTEEDCKKACAADQTCKNLDFDKELNCWFGTEDNPTLSDNNDVTHWKITRDCSNECKNTKIGNNFAGKISTTRNGHKCQDWASQAPHKHKVFTSFPEGSEVAAKNYCRNPDNEANGPWCYTTDPNVRWENCDVKGCECKTTKGSTDYAGTVSQTVSGRTCQPWTSQTPHEHKQTFKYLPKADEAAAKNYCRNADGVAGGPWCYTTDPKVRWEYCDIKMCECRVSKTGTDYAGTVSQTVTGRTCQEWASQSPHAHTQTFKYLPKSDEAAAKNYCRNADGVAGGPWCYTTDPKVRWEYCDIKYC